MDRHIVITETMYICHSHTSYIITHSNCIMLIFKMYLFYVFCICVPVVHAVAWYLEEQVNLLQLLLYFLPSPFLCIAPVLLHVALLNLSSLHSAS